MIERDEARRIAEFELLRRGLGSGITSVRRTAEMARPPWAYNGPDFTSCWIAYAEPRADGRLESSMIIAVDTMSGLVRYVGSANDEG